MLVSGSAYHLKYVFFAKMLRGISPYNSAVVEWPLLMIFRTLGNYPPENSQREPKNVRFGEWFSSSKTWFSGSTLLSWGLKRQNLPQVAFCQPTMADFGVWDFQFIQIRQMYMFTQPLCSQVRNGTGNFLGSSMSSLSGPSNHWKRSPKCNRYAHVQWFRWSWKYLKNPGSLSVRLPRFFSSQRLRHWFFFFREGFTWSSIPGEYSAFSTSWAPIKNRYYQWSWHGAPYKSTKIKCVFTGGYI